MSGLVWSGLVWSGLVWSGLVWSDLVLRNTILLECHHTFTILLLYDDYAITIRLLPLYYYYYHYYKSSGVFAGIGSGGSRSRRTSSCRDVSSRVV